jgi:hypothetical protein
MIGSRANVQDTIRASRIGAYFDAIPHWLYFTWRRSNGPLRSEVVIWLSGARTVMSNLGLVVGVWLYSPSKRYRFPDDASRIPYAGPKRWHARRPLWDIVVIALMLGGTALSVTSLVIARRVVRRKLVAQRKPSMQEDFVWP